MRLRLEATLMSILVACACPGAARAEVDPRLAEVFERICIGSFPSFVPSPEALAAFAADGDDPATPARSTRGGTAREWSIDAKIEGRYNLLVQTSFGKVERKPASGCRLTSSGRLEAPVLERILAVMPGAKSLEYRSEYPQLDIRRWTVRLSGRDAVFSVYESNEASPIRPHLSVMLERFPRSVVEGWRRKGRD